MNNGASKQIEDVENFGKDEGLIHEAVVTGRKVGAGQKFWAALAHNQKLFQKVVKFVNQRIELEGVQNEFLELISINESLILDPVDGQEILAEAEDVFSCIDSNFKNYSADEKGPATKATPVQVYKMTKDATFSQLFGSLSLDPSELCLTQAQIKNFAKKYRNWLRVEGWACETFFFFESNKNFFVASVYILSGALNVNVKQFENLRVQNVAYLLRLVIPQLA